MAEAINIFAFDPGDVNNGFCFFKWDRETKKADLRIKKILSPEELRSFLKVVWGLAESPETKCVFVIENFRVDTMVRGAKFQFSEMLTSRAIGAIEMVANWTNSKVVFQEPGNVLPNARRWYPKKLNRHIDDDVSAYMHGVHFMMTSNLIRTNDDVLWFGQETL